MFLNLPKTFDRLVQNTSGVTAIIPNNFGLSDKEDNVLLYSSTGASGLSSTDDRNIQHVGITMDGREEIKLTTLDAYCERNHIDHIESHLLLLKFN